MLRFIQIPKFWNIPSVTVLTTLKLIYWSWRLLQALQRLFITLPGSWSWALVDGQLFDAIDQKVHLLLIHVHWTSTLVARSWHLTYVSKEICWLKWDVTPVLSLTIARVYKMWDCNIFLSETCSGEKGSHMFKCPWQPSDTNCAK